MTAARPVMLRFQESTNDEKLNYFKKEAPSENIRIAQLTEQADKLKTFGNKTPTTIILAGAYDFFHMILVSAQVARRSTIVHMEPYKNTEDGLIGFSEALMGPLKHMHALNMCASIAEKSKSQR